MPLYEYTCENCSFNFEELQKISDPPLITCPQCGKDKLKRLIGTGALIFKGSGFYITDYKNKPAEKTRTPDKKSPANKSEGHKKDSSSVSQDNSGTPASDSATKSNSE